MMAAAFSTRREWSTEYMGRTAHHQFSTGPGRWPPSTTLTFHTERPCAQLQPGEIKQTQESEDAERIDIQRPTVGRTGALGRRVEKPADVKPAGPSGQKDKAQHDRKHANK